MKFKRDIWFVSDLHRGHPNILEFEKRPYASVDVMNDAITKSINQYVKPNDLVYDLGDTMWSTQDFEIHKRCNGKWILIRGNHDKDVNKIRTRGGYIAVLQEAEIEIAKQRVLLSHYPYKYGKIKHYWTAIKRWFTGKGTVPRHMEKRPVERDQWMLHGHIHGKSKLRGKQIHVGWDAWHRPVNISEIESFMQKYPNGGDL